MRVRVIGFVGMFLMGAAPAFAGGGTGYSHSVEQGIHVFKGQHGAIVSHQELALIEAQNRRQAERDQAEEVARLRAQLAAQKVQIDTLSSVVTNLEEPPNSRSTRRRAFYGNPRFFGRNGFIGNRYYGGVTVQLPKKRKRPYK